MTISIETINPCRIRDRAEQLVKDRFRYADLEQPAMKTLFQLGLEHALKIFHDPSGMSNGRGDKDRILGTMGVWHDPSNPIAPLELLIKDIKLPALPEVLLKLFQVINDSKSSASDLAAVIGMDTALSSYLLRLVNSAYYSFPFPIDTIDRAITLLGTREISLLAFSSSFLNVFKQIKSQQMDIEAFWKHSICCAIIARTLARHFEMKNPDRHFLAGLLHDIGRLVIFSNIPHSAHKVLAERETEGIPLCEAERRVLGFDHSRFGAALLAKWNFPATLVAAVQHHHFPPETGDYDEPKTVHLADTITKALGIGLSGDGFVPPLDSQTWEGLGLVQQDLIWIIEELGHELDEKFQILFGIKEAGFAKPAP